MAHAYPGSVSVLGTTLNQRFTLDQELGRGGMGAVFRATDQVLQRSVAIKILREKAGEEVGKKIRLEAQILARLLHDNIVRLYDFGEANGIYYFVMEEVDGSSFQKRAKHLELSRRVAILAQVAGALDYAHHQGVIHRDVKPANVLLTAAEAAKLSDFGLSLIADVQQATGTIKGTPHYMSPEQAKGGRLDFRTDLYSLGVMAYEAATGTTPFSGSSMAVIACHVNQAPEPPRSRNPEISPGLEAVILRMMAKNPSARFNSGAEIADRLRDLLRIDSTLGGDDTLATTQNPPSTIMIPGEPAGPTLARTLAGGDPALASTVASAAALPRVPAPPSNDPATVARRMIADVVADPITLTADERYLEGHYLAYFLGGSRRRGFFRRRPLDPLNADRARLILAMTWLMIVGPTDEAIQQASVLLEGSHDVRPALSPVVVSKYLESRDNPTKRKVFRTARKRLQEASPGAAERMTDERGVLNPGLIPQTLDDLRKVAPARTEVDDRLVNRWNRVAEVWRGRPDFRMAVLGYATQSAWRDPASAELWPEVVYPLIERARWQRSLRSGPEVIWDQFCDALRLPDAGVQFDRAIRKAVPVQVVEQLDLSLGSFEEEPQLDADLALAEAGPALVMASDSRSGSVSLHELATDMAPEKTVVRLVDVDPIRLTMGELRELWHEAAAAMKTPGARVGHRKVAIGPYHLSVIPSIRGRSAGEVAIQGMGHKQIEMLVPSIRLGSDTHKPIIAVWVYQDNSLVITYLDPRAVARYISWHAPTNHQTNYDDPGQLNSDLLVIGLEAPDQLDRALSRRFRPRNKV